MIIIKILHDFTILSFAVLYLTAPVWAAIYVAPKMIKFVTRSVN